MKERNFAFNIVIDALVASFSLLGVLTTLAGWHFMMDLPRLTEAPFLLTFTGWSNIAVGLVALICLCLRLGSRCHLLPRPLYVIRLLSVAEIAITFFITACYLAPSVGEQWWRLYINGSLFNHLLTPLCAILGFVFVEERKELPFRYCFFSFLPMGVYGLFYFVRCYTHIDASGNVDLYYDIYGLTRWGVMGTLLLLIGFLALSFGFTVLFYFLCRFKKSKKADESIEEPQ